MKKLKKNQMSGITLIALVVTIIVLLILAGISIQMLSGDNGILQRATTAKENTGREEIIENARLDIIAQIAENNGRTITEQQLKTILKKYFNDEEVENIEINENLSESTEELTTSNGIIKLIDIYNGLIVKSYVGYYADLNGDNEINVNDDGIIFLDMMVGAYGTGLREEYSVSSVTNGLKNYEISTSTYQGKFGTQKWVKPTNGTTGLNRFYVMALQDIDETSHCWYDSANTDRQDITLITQNGVGIDYNNKAIGRENTERVMEKWMLGENGGWGPKGTIYTDMFEVIENKYNDEIGWFIPSKKEWAAFAGSTINGKNVASNYNDFELSNQYWSSSQNEENLNCAWCARFNRRRYLWWIY